ncbi:MAG: pilus assembly protein PilZ [Parafilimonas terrae]|nr:pilus assembly protein PilZ [Parafilimonas terrae]
MSEDRRGAYRRNAFTFGAVDPGGSEVGCLVWDVNEAGALIEVEDALGLPDRVRIRLAPETEPREASVAWRRGKRAGLSFAR